MQKLLERSGLGVEPVHAAYDSIDDNDVLNAVLSPINPH